MLVLVIFAMFQWQYVTMPTHVLYRTNWKKNSTNILRDFGIFASLILPTSQPPASHPKSTPPTCLRGRQTERQRDRETERPRDRETERQRDRETQTRRCTDGQTNKRS